VYGIRAFWTQVDDMDLGRWTFAPNALGEIGTITKANIDTDGARQEGIRVDSGTYLRLVSCHCYNLAQRGTSNANWSVQKYRCRTAVPFSSML
jgi:hypothetical protein